MIAYTDMSMDQYLTLERANNNFKSETDREVLEAGLTVVGIFAL